jgi:hypothetical protein
VDADVASDESLSDVESFSDDASGAEGEPDPGESDPDDVEDSDDESADDDESDEGSATATQGNATTAVPMPSATASAPTRPMYFALPIVQSP